ncbi:MAG: polymerase sigma 70 [Subtercola sp.]|nr:polymerase sigma 70 [Subtercola sp.]
MAPISDADDRTLAGRAADGDVRAFEILVRRYAGLMRGYAGRMLQSTDEVDDVVQAAFITAWQQLPNLADPSVVKSWMMRIVNRKALDRIRARHPHDELGSPASRGLPAPVQHSPEAVAEHHAVRSALSQVLAGLPEQQRQCWLMKEVAGYSYDDIADELGLPVSTVRGLLSRARKRVISEMEAWR